MAEPLANKIRPTSLKDYVGQEHLVGKGKPLRMAIEHKKMFSFILSGPPGVGKTTIARIYANAMDAEFFELSAVSASKDDIKKIVEQPAMFGKAKILFLDEIHRFNKAQQDYLLPFVENGKLFLIGATTENPSFEVISPLLSRCQVFVLKQLNEDEIKTIILRIARDRNIKIDDDDVFATLINISNGDARHIITIIESVLELYGSLSVENIKQAVEKL